MNGGIMMGEFVEGRNIVGKKKIKKWLGGLGLG